MLKLDKWERPQHVNVSGMTVDKAVEQLKTIPKIADVELSEVPDKVALNIPLRKVVRIYAAFEYDCFKSQVVEFTRQGKVHLRKE